jgi:EmrB/QacA subfamily drug resistance transporter
VSHEGIILALACFAQFMVVLDVSVVNVALPAIGRGLHFSPTGLQWVVNAYVLTFAGFLLLGGRAADLFGRRRIYIFGVVLFASASLVGGFAQNSAWLTAARAVQGVGGAFLSPATLTVILTTFSSGPRMTRALGIWSAMGGAGGATGVFLGGLLTSELSWRWILFINVPLCAITVVVALAYLTEWRNAQAARRLDIVGAITVTAGLAAVVYGIVSTDQYGWGSGHTITALGAGFALLGVFALVQTRVSAPLVPFRLFRSRWVTGANLIMLCMGGAFFAMWYFLSLYIQDVHHFSPLRTGVAFLPWTLAIVVGAQLSARLLARIGVRTMLVASTSVAALGFFWLSRIQPDSSYWYPTFGGALLTSFALGLLFTPVATAATTGVARSEAGLASGALNTSRQVGGSLGLAILATVASSHTRSLVHAGTAATAALSSGYALALLVGGGLCLLALVATRALPSVPRAASVGGAGKSSPALAADASTSSGAPVGATAEATLAEATLAPATLAAGAGEEP